MVNNEKISVIVPVYNVEKYLNKCIESIIGQTYKNLEIILVDDGSTDKSGLLCDDYSKKDNRIHVIHKKNGGLSDARNKGIDYSTGDYLVFVDSDDYLHLEFIEKLYNALKISDADLSICNFSKVYPNGEVSDDGILIDEVITGKQAVHKLFEKNCVSFIVAWNKLYKRQLFNNVKYPVGRINEDEFVIHRILGQCNKIACVKSSMYFYFQRADSIMGKINKADFDYMSNRTDFLFDRMHYLKSINMDDFASKIYWEIIIIYKFFIENKYDKIQSGEINQRVVQLKKELRKNFNFSMNFTLKRRIKILFILNSKTFIRFFNHKNK